MTSAKGFKINNYGNVVAGYAQYVSGSSREIVFVNLSPAGSGIGLTASFGGSIAEMRAVAACIIAACDEADAEAAAKAAQREAA